MLIIGIVVFVLLIALISSNKSKKKINETAEKDNSIKRKLELEILIKQASQQGIDVSEYQSELNRLKSSGSDSKDAADKYM